MSKSDPPNTVVLRYGETRRAGALLADGKLVVFPTETVYGLGASAVDPVAVRRIFHAKARPADNPLIVHFSSSLDVLRLLPDDAADLVPLINELMPGPFTAVVDTPHWAPPVVRGGLDSIAVRVPAHPVAAGIIAAAGVPIAAPSANRSGRPSPTTFEMAWAEMAGRVDAVVDGGNCAIGIESTVVDVRERGVLTILRPGKITARDLSALSRREIRLSGTEGHRSPGTRYRHYHPGVPVIVVSSGLWDDALREASRRYNYIFSRRLVDFGTVERFAEDLYRCFWLAEREGAQCILMEDVSITDAPGLHDRLHRAADGVYAPGVITDLHLDTDP